jgi:hypothetical protein
LQQQLTAADRRSRWCSVGRACSPSLRMNSLIGCGKVRPKPNSGRS